MDGCSDQRKEWELVWEGRGRGYEERHLVRRLLCCLIYIPLALNVSWHSSVCFFIYLRLALMRRNQCLVVQGLDTNHQIRRKSEVYDLCIKERRSMLARLHPDVYAQHLWPNPKRTWQKGNLVAESTIETWQEARPTRYMLIMQFTMKQNDGRR